jgi:hypothetical protein
VNCAIAYARLGLLERQGWLVEVRAALGGGVLVIACRGDREIRETGACVADIADQVIGQARAWCPPPRLPLAA